MRQARLLPLFAVLLIVSCFSAQAEGPVHEPQANSGDAQAKVDPILRMLLAGNERSLQETGQPLNLTLFADLLGVYADNRPVLEGPRVAGRQVVEQVRADRVGVLVTIEGSPEKLKQTGAQVGTVAGNIVTAHVSLDQLEHIAALPNVTYVAASHRLQLFATETPGSPGASLRHPNLDLSMPETGAADCHALGNTGAGAVVGVVDTGLDQTHLDFQDRIVCYHSQTGNPLDTDGHGTHVTGIAAGDGSSSSAGYVGIAPEADICAVKTDMTEAGIIEGVDYIFTQASALGKPAVVNLSLGSYFGPHDGTTSVEQALESLLGPGKIVVAAAGNAGNEAIHAGGDVPAGGCIDITSDVEIPLLSGIFDYWYDGATDVCVTVISPNGLTVGPVCSGALLDWRTNPVGVTPDGCVYVDNASAGPAPNGDNELLTDVESTFFGCPSDPAVGTWTYHFCAEDAARIDGWLIYWLIPQEFNPPYGDTDMTVGMPATAKEIIAVASHVTKDCWESIDGNTYCYTDPAVIEGAISPYSSKGPTRDGRLKPDISAPGQGIASAISKDARSSMPVGLIMPDDRHWVIQGTSMSSPHVAGAVALLLEQNPSLTAVDVKALLQSNALQDTFTGPTPNLTWGAGKLRVPGCGTPDLDNDGFHDDVERYLDTDPFDACPDDPSDDAWPLDMNNDGLLNLGGDVINYYGKIGCEVATNPECQRLDLNMDGLLNLGGDVINYYGMIGEMCT